MKNISSQIFNLIRIILQHCKEWWYFTNKLQIKMYVKVDPSAGNTHENQICRIVGLGYSGLSNKYESNY